MPTVELKKIVDENRATLGFSWRTLEEVKKRRRIPSFKFRNGTGTGAWHWTLKNPAERDAAYQAQKEQAQQAQQQKTEQTARENWNEVTLDRLAQLDAVKRSEVLKKISEPRLNELDIELGHRNAKHGLSEGERALFDAMSAESERREDEEDSPTPERHCTCDGFPCTCGGEDDPFT